MSHTVRLTAVGCALALLAAMGTPAAGAAPLPLTHQSTAVSDTPNDGVIAAGDELAIVETVHNTGGSPITGLSATLTSSTAGVTVTQGAASYPDVASGGSSANATPFTVSLSPSMPCGTTVALTLTLTSGGDVATVPLSLATGVTGGLVDYAGNPVTIGGSTSTLRHLTSSLSSSGAAAVASAGSVRSVQVHLDSLEYPDVTRLGLALRAPNGTIVPLVDPGRGAPGASFVDTELVPSGSALDTGSAPYTGTFQADGDLGALAGLDQQGTWRLVVTGSTVDALGRVDGWTLRIATADCSPRSGAHLVVPAGSVLPGASVDLDATGSTSVDPPITRYEWDLGDGSFADGPALNTATFARGRYTIRVRVSDGGGVIGTASATLVVSQPPVADIASPATAPKEGSSLVLDGAASSDPDGDPIARYDWDLDGDGEFDDATGAHPSLYLADAGLRTLGLQVTDADGATGQTTALLNVAATVPPTAALVATPNPAMVGQPVVFDASGSTDDSSVTGYAWDLDGDGSFETQGGATATRAYPNASVVRVAVRVTDDDGRTAVARVPLTIQSAAGRAVGGGDGEAGREGTATTDGGSNGGTGDATQAGAGLGASLTADARQALRTVGAKGLSLRCRADRVATCSVTATLRPADARRLGLSTSRTRSYVLGRATVRLAKAGSTALRVHLSARAVKRLKRLRAITVVVVGTAVDRKGTKATLSRSVTLRR